MPHTPFAGGQQRIDDSGEGLCELKSKIRRDRKGILFHYNQD